MMPTPQAMPWFNTLDVRVDVNIAAEVHVDTTLDFTPTDSSHRGTLYGPGAFHVVGLPTGTDLYTRLVSIDGEDISECTPPVQITRLV